jgi:hypothetical protein
MNRKYALSIPGAEVKLIFSYIGYLVKEVVTNGSGTILIIVPNHPLKKA